MTSIRKRTVKDFRRGRVVPGRVAEQAAAQKPVSGFKAAKQAARRKPRKGASDAG